MKYKIILTIFCFFLLSTKNLTFANVNDNLVGNSLSFDGLDDKVVLPAMDLNSEFTIGTWVLISSDLSIFGDILSIGPYSLALNAVNGDWNNNEIDISPPFVKYSLNHSNSSNGWYDPIIGLVETGQWHYIVATYSNELAKLYIDGQMVGQKDMPNINIDGAIWIGDRDFGSSFSYNFNGNMSQLGIWDRELSQEEILIQMLSEVPNSETNLLGFWNFNSNNNSVILLDNSGNNNDGNIDGASWSTNKPILGCTDNLATNFESNANFNDGTCSGYPNETNFSLSYDGDEDYVHFGNDESLNITNFFTVQAWVYYKGGGGYNSKIIGKRFGNEPESTWNFGLYGSTLNFEGRFGNGDGTGMQNYFFRPNVTLPQDSWHHVAATFSTITGKLIIYLDGEEVFVDNTMQGKTIYRSEANVTIGTDVDWTDWFDGEIDEVSLLNKTLSQDEIVESMYNGILSQHKNDLRGYWKFNSGSGSVIFDHSGNGNHGTISNAIWVDEVPVFGCIDSFSSNYNIDANIDDGSCSGYPENGNYALSFDGTNDYVVGSAYQSLDASITNEITISAWVKVNDFTNGQTIISHGGNGFNQYNLAIDGGHLYFLTAGANGSPGSFENGSGNYTSSSLNVDQWHHVTMTYDQESLKLYIDGNLDFENQIVDNFPDNTGEFNIGRSTETYGGAFNGYIRDIQIWNVPLNELEIQNYMEDVPLGNEDGLVGYWKLN